MVKAADHNLNLSQTWNFDHEEKNLENGEKAGDQDILLFPHLKANNVGEGENAGKQHFLLFLCLFVSKFVCLFFPQRFLLCGIKIRDCLGEESIVENRNKTMPLVEFLRKVSIL